MSGSHLSRRTRVLAGSAGLLLGLLIGLPLVGSSGPGPARHRPAAEAVTKPTAPTTSAPVASPSSAAVPSAAVPTTSPPTPPTTLPPQSVADVVVARGAATAYGCTAALSYLHAYAAPGFSVACPAYSQGHQATTTCISGSSPCSDGGSITIAVPCAAAYMNEASNSWVLSGQSNAAIDPYGYCH
jgi:hypothetical protein